MSLLIGMFILACGITAGLILGRIFCKQHHDVVLAPPTPAEDAAKISDVDGCQTGTIGEEIERNGGCTPGCCGDKE